MYYWAARILVLSLTKGSVSHTGAACMLVCSGFTTLYGNYDIVEVWHEIKSMQRHETNLMYYIETWYIGNCIGREEWQESRQRACLQFIRCICRVLEAPLPRNVSVVPIGHSILDGSWRCHLWIDESDTYVYPDVFSRTSSHRHITTS